MNCCNPCSDEPEVRSCIITFFLGIRLDEADEGRNRFNVDVALQLCGMRLMREGWSVRSSVHPPRSFAYPRVLLMVCTVDSAGRSCQGSHATRSEAIVAFCHSGCLLVRLGAKPHVYSSCLTQNGVENRVVPLIGTQKGPWLLLNNI